VAEEARSEMEADEVDDGLERAEIPTL